MQNGWEISCESSIISFDTPCIFWTLKVNFSPCKTTILFFSQIGKRSRPHCQQECVKDRTCSGYFMKGEHCYTLGETWRYGHFQEEEVRFKPEIELWFEDTCSGDKLLEEDSRGWLCSRGSVSETFGDELLETNWWQELRLSLLLQWWNAVLMHRWLPILLQVNMRE